MLRDPTAHPESAAEIKKKMSARLEIELEMNTYIQDYVYTLKGVGGKGMDLMWVTTQSQPSRQLLRLGRVVLVRKKEEINV